MAPLNGEAFVSYTKEVHTYLVKFVTGNAHAESKMQPHLNTTNGRIDFKALTDYYEGVGIHSVDRLHSQVATLCG